MAYEMIPRPYMLYETAAMLYKFVNSISFRSTMSLHLDRQLGSQWTVQQADALQAVLDSTCKGLSPSDPELAEFFTAIDPDEHQEGTCLGYLMIFSFFTLRSPELHETIEAIRRNWNLLREKGAWVQGVTNMSLQFSCGEDCPGDLLDQITRLPLPPEFQIRLCKALRDFDSTLTRLEALMAPIARRLAENLGSCHWIWEERAKYWQSASPLDYVSAVAGQPVFPDPEEQVQVAILGMIHNFLFVKQSEAQPGLSYLYMGCGATAKSQKRSRQITCEMMSSALKSISDRKRLEILCTLARDRAYSLELAERMQMDPSNMSRSLSQLCSFGFLRQEKDGQKIFYETDRDAVRHFLRQLEHFIMN